jgi:arylsulfatase
MMKTTVAQAADPLPSCAIVERRQVVNDGGGQGKGGTGTLSVNGKKVGEGRFPKTVPLYFSTDDAFDVGEDWGTPVAPTYNLQFRFTGTLKTVTVEVK